MPGFYQFQGSHLLPSACIIETAVLSDKVGYKESSLPSYVFLLYSQTDFNMFSTSGLLAAEVYNTAC